MSHLPLQSVSHAEGATKIDSLVNLSITDNTILSSPKNYTIVDPFVNGSLSLTIEDDASDNKECPTIINREIIDATFFYNKNSTFPYFVLIMDDNGQTALHLAVLRRLPTIVRRLILAGADPAVIDFKGNTALHLACESGDLECVKALTCPFTPAEQSIVKSGLKYPPLPQDLEQRNWNGIMCLHIAVSKHDYDIAYHLMKLGADWSARDGRDGNTALHIAIQTKQSHMALMLLQECTSNFFVHERNFKEESAYVLALQYNQTQVADKLAELGAILPGELLIDQNNCIVADF